MKKIIFIQSILCVVMLFGGCNSQDNFKFQEEDDRVNVIIGDQLFTSYRYSSDLLKPSLHPVISPTGEIVTRGYPFEEIEGESSDHPHHTGVYFTYGNRDQVNGDSFWNQHDGPQKIKHVKILAMEEDTNKGKLSTRSHWINSQGRPILEEDRRMEFYSSEDEYRIDFTIRLSAIDTTVTFADTKEGMFAIRVADWLTENTTGTLYNSTGEYLNAEGDRTEENIWGKRSSWVRLEGKKDDKTIGVAMYHHPNSTNYPTYWHARGYGCFAANPIGQYEFQEARQVEDPEYRTLTLRSGETALFKFRMIIYEGSKGKEYFDQGFEDFSQL